MSLTPFQQIFIIALGAMQGYKYKRKFAWKIHDIHKFICGWFHLNIKYQQIYQIMLDMVKSGEYVDGYYDLCSAYHRSSGGYHCHEGTCDYSSVGHQHC